MPELPEVETVARGLAQRIVGDVIESVWLGAKPEPLKSPPRLIAKALEGGRITVVQRRGKHVVIELENEQKAHRRAVKAHRSKSVPSRSHFVVHLGMTGQLLVVRPDAPLAKHTHLIARLKSGKELRFIDPRRFGRLSVLPEFQAAGQEPLNIGLELFAGLFRARNAPIKSALLNQKLLSGIGNIYADESLVRAGIRPRRRAASLTRSELMRLYDAIQQVLNEAIAAGGSSVSDYVDSDGQRGFFQFQHRVYGREGEPCLVCGAPIKRIVIAGRSAHYCPKCQR